MSQPSMYQESLRAFLKPILKYLDDDSVSEIMINGPNEIWIESRGKVTLTDATFTEEGLLGAARNMAQFVGRVITDERPQLDARLPDGSRIHVVLPPIARKGTTISIRKFLQGRPGIDKLVEWGSMTPQMAHLIKALVQTKLNIVVSGGTGSGKTTLLNIVSTLIPNDERILTIEDSAELQLQQDHVVPFESRPADKLGKGEVNMGRLLHSALRLRPDRIVVGEVRGGEAFDLMQAMNTGHGGSMATLHANTPTDTLRRLEALCLMSSVDMPMVAVRAQVASAINVVITCERFHDGSRRTTAIAEVLPLDEKGEYRTQSLFVYVPTHKDANGTIHGFHAPTGVLPTFLGRLQAHGFPDVNERFFDPSTYGVPPPPAIFCERIATRWAPSLKHRERGEPDPRDLQEAMERASESAEVKEREHKEKVQAGTFLDGYSFVADTHGRAKPAEPQSPSPEPAPIENRKILPPPRVPPIPTTALAMNVTDPPAQRPAHPPVARRPLEPEPKVQIGGGFSAEAREDEPAPAPRTGLPPGKRPLPPGKRPLPRREIEEREEDDALASGPPPRRWRAGRANANP